MSYTEKSQIPPPIAERERELLAHGYSYPEVAAMTGGRVKSISERNRLVYKIPIWEAFALRIQRDGIPSRMTVDDAFGYWFSGFFDGEGSIGLFTRRTRDPRYSEYRMFIRLHIRDDDVDVIYRIKDELQVGRIAFHGSQGRTNPSVSFCVEKVQDLAEVIIPLFHRYPLHTKKRNEFAVWEPIVRQRYIDTLAGYSNRSSIPEEHRIAFHETLDHLREIRSYS